MVFRIVIHLGHGHVEQPFGFLNLLAYLGQVIKLQGGSVLLD